MEHHPARKSRCSSVSTIDEANVSLFRFKYRVNKCCKAVLRTVELANAITLFKELTYYIPLLTDSKPTNNASDLLPLFVWHGHHIWVNRIKFLPTAPPFV